MPIKKYFRNGLARGAAELRDPNRLKVDIFDLAFSVATGVIIVGALSIVTWMKGTPLGSAGPTVQQRAGQLSKSLSEAALLIDQMKSEIDSRQTMVAKLQGDMDTYNKLTALKRDEVEAVAQVLRGELNRGSRSAFWIGVAANFGFFLAGSLVTWSVARWQLRRQGLGVPRS